MAQQDWIIEVADRACREVLAENSAPLSAAIAARVAAQWDEAKPPKATPGWAELHSGVAQIAAAHTQGETLTALLTAVSAFAPACGLMILRGAQAVGWSAIGWGAGDSFRHAVLDCAHGTVAEILYTRRGRAVACAELDATLRQQLGLATADELLILPVALKGTVAALLVATAAQESALVVLESLVQITQLAIDLQAYRKTAVVPAPAPTPSSLHTRAVSSASTPSAVHAAPTAASTTGLDPLHEKAQRFAKLLVEEIKLYNQAKVAEGRANATIYSLLRDGIEKSREAYRARYGDQIRDVDYFKQELIRILADNNPDTMGAGFPG